MFPSIINMTWEEEVLTSGHCAGLSALSVALWPTGQFSARPRPEPAVSPARLSCCLSWLRKSSRSPVMSGAVLCFPHRALLKLLEMKLFMTLVTEGSGGLTQALHDRCRAHCKQVLQRGREIGSTLNIRKCVHVYARAWHLWMENY